MSRPRLHLDADTSRQSLLTALLAHGHDVTRTPNEWMPEDATDEEQLLGSTAQQRCIFTFNISHFAPLAGRHPHHRGVVLANQLDWRLSDMIRALDWLLTETEAEYWIGQTRWLNDWRRSP